MSFKLDNGTKVQVNRTSENFYHFFLTTPGGATDNFEYREDDRLKEEVEQPLDFSQVDALRTFWLKREESL